MKKYKLLKDLPLAKAGTIFEKVNDFEMCQIGDSKGHDISLEFFGDKFDEWLEEVEESGMWKPQKGDIYNYLEANGYIESQEWDDFPEERHYLEIGNVFKTKEEAEQTVEKLKALKRLRDLGFKFDSYVLIRKNRTSIHEGLGVIIDASLSTPHNGNTRQISEDLTLLFEEEE